MDRKQEKFKILKFGGTSLGTVERIKHVANLICNNELNLVVLSAMSGTTNSLAEIASLLFNGDIDGAQRDIECLKSKYIEVADKLYLSAKSIEEAKDIAINQMGVNFIDVDVNAFKQKVLPLHEQMLKENPKIVDLYNHIQEANEKAKGGQ